MPGRTYLDHNATTPLRPEARAALIDALDRFGNPSSVHAEGRAARGLIEEAREAVAALVDAAPGEVVFMSGGTEANNAILWAWWDTLFVSAIEHPSVLEPARSCGARLFMLRVTPGGVLDCEDLAQVMEARAHESAQGLVSIQLANNETGVLQPVAEAVRLAHAHQLSVHTDAVQALGRVPLSFAELGVDFMTLSAHKVGGPKGVGALVIKKGSRLEPFLRGGGQEGRMRAGTENLPAIAGFGAAAAAMRGEAREHARLAALRDRLEQGVRALTPAALIVGGEARRLPNTSCIALPGASAEELVIALDLAGVAVSAGAACSSGKVAPSHVLAAMLLPAELAGSAIRVSLGWSSGQADVAAFLAVWERIAGGRRKAPRTRRAVA